MHRSPCRFDRLLFSEANLYSTIGGLTLPIGFPLVIGVRPGGSCFSVSLDSLIWVADVMVFERANGDVLLLR